MKRIILLSISLVTLTGAMIFSGAEKKSALTWHGMTDGVRRARAEQKKILIDVYTDWCSWCKKMEKEVYANEEIKNYLAKNFVLVKVNAESQKEQIAEGVAVTEKQLAQAFGVKGYPTIIFLQEDAAPITILEGYKPAPEFLDALTYIRENIYMQKSFEEWKEKK